MSGWIHYAGRDKGQTEGPNMKAYLGSWLFGMSLGAKRGSR